MNHQKQNKDEGRRRTVYVVKREFQGTVTADHAVKRLIGSHLERREQDAGESSILSSSVKRGWG